MSWSETLGLYILAFAVGLLGLVWVGYPLSLLAAVRLVGLHRRPSDDRRSDCAKPTVTIIIAAHNEASVILRKMENCLRQSYPPDLLDVIVASDHSTDATEEIVRSFSSARVRLLRAVGHGKSAAQNEAVEYSRGELLVFTDAATRLSRHTIDELVVAQSPPRVGAVAGRLVWENEQESSITKGGGIYWTYEHLLWRLESRIGLLGWVSGACFLVRRDLFQGIDGRFGDDVIVPLDVLAQGYRVAFADRATAFEERIATAGDEIRARARMTLRSLTGTISRASLINPLRHPFLLWAIACHKILRWFNPLLLLVIVVESVVLLPSLLAMALLGVQAVFYGLALLGHCTRRRHWRSSAVTAPYAFVVMNIGLAWGLLLALSGRRVVTFYRG